MAEKRTIDINIKNNADEATKDFNHFNDALDQTAKSAKNVNSTFEEVYGDLQPLTTRLGEAEDRLYELAIAGDTTSKEYQELLTKVGEYRKVQIQTDLAVDGAATTLTQKLGSALNGATSGFAATQGAIALFGEENEALEKSLLKVQSALAIQQGVDGLRTSYKELGSATGIATKAQAALNFVINLNPFVLITTAIVGAIAALATFTSALDPVIDKVKQFGDFLGLTNFEEEEREEARKKRAEAQRKRQEQEIERETKLADLRKRRFQDNQKQFERNIALLQAENKDTFALEQLKEFSAIMEAKRDKIYAKQQIQRIRLLKRRLDGQSEEAKKFEQQIDAFNQAIKDSNQQILDSNNQLKLNTINNNKAKADSYREYRDTRLQIARQIEDLENELLEEGLEKELEINRDRFRRLREDAEKNTKLTREERNRLIELYEEQGQQKAEEIRAKYRQKEIDAERKLQQQLEAERNAFEDEIAAIEEANYQALLTDQERELLAVQDKYFRLETLAEGNAEALNAIEEARLNEENAINLKYQNEAYEAQKALNEQEIADAKAAQQAKIQFANDAFGAIGELANAFAGESEKSQKRAFQINKAVGIAQAIVNTAGAVSAAINPAVGGLGIPAGLPGAALAAATGAAQIATIAKTKFQGGSSGDVSAPSEAGLGEAVSPQFNVVGESGVNQLAQLQQQPTQAYVVSGDVTSAQALDRNRVQNATL